MSLSLSQPDVFCIRDLTADRDYCQNPISQLDPKNTDAAIFNLLKPDLINIKFPVRAL